MGRLRSKMGACDALILTVAMPLFALYWVLAHIGAWLITMLVLPSHLLAQKLCVCGCGPPSALMRARASSQRARTADPAATMHHLGVETRLS
jgi:hypothetical protein